MQFEQNPVEHADAAAGAEHRHRPRPQPPRARSCRASRRLRHRPVRAADRRSASSSPASAYGLQRRGRPRAARARRPHARDVVPDRRRRRPVQRGPRLRAAPPDAARDRPGPPDRHRAGLPAALRARSCARRWAPHYPELLEQADTVDMWLRTEEEAFNRTLEQGLKMLEDVIAQARARRRGGHRRRRGVQAARHVRLPVRPHARARRRARPRRRRAGLRVADGGAARPRARQRGPRGRRGRAREAARVRDRARARRRVFTGYETTEQATAVAAVDARERPRAGQARRVPVLRHRRRPGPRRAA